MVERDLPREYLYLCDELFMCGTAAEITPIRSVDGSRSAPASRAGHARMQELFFGLFDGRTEDQLGLARTRRSCRARPGRAAQDPVVAARA